MILKISTPFYFLNPSQLQPTDLHIRLLLIISTSRKLENTFLKSTATPISYILSSISCLLYSVFCLLSPVFRLLSPVFSPSSNTLFPLKNTS